MINFDSPQDRMSRLDALRITGARTRSSAVLARTPSSAALTAAILGIVMASVAGAQEQTWIEQLGTTVGDGVDCVAPDGSGGVFVGGNTWVETAI